MSVLWCAAASKHAFFSKVKFDTYEEQLRQMLVADDPGEPWRYCCLMTGIQHEGNLVQIVVEPIPLRLMSAPGRAVYFRRVLLGIPDGEPPADRPSSASAVSAKIGAPRPDIREV